MNTKMNTKMISIMILVSRSALGTRRKKKYGTGGGEWRLLAGRGARGNREGEPAEGWESRDRGIKGIGGQEYERNGYTRYAYGCMNH